jgi:hypothetical protein
MFDFGLYLKIWVKWCGPKISLNVLESTNIYRAEKTSPTMQYVLGPTLTLLLE